MNSVGLIAMREVRTRLRSKAYIISTIALVVILIALAVVTKLTSGGGGADFTIGVTAQTSSLSAPLIGIGTSVDQSVRTVTVADEATGRAEVRKGTIDALLTGDGTTVAAVVKKNIDPNLSSLLHVLAGQVVLDQKITALGGDPASVGTAISTAPVTVTTLEPPHPYDTQRLILGIVAGVLIYISLLLNGQAVASGVVEEKTSRVVEILLATVRPWQLMAGKVLGIGLVGLVQIAVVGSIGIGSALATGALTISGGAAAGTVIWLIAWYVLGFLAYALAFAAVAALVSRQEDVNGVVAPLMVLVVAGYSLGASILPSNPGSNTIATLSMIPTFAPTLMPMRLAMGGVPIWQSVVSVAAVIVLIPLLVWLSGRIYRNAVLRSGARVKLRDAWRAA